jgi:hypothetical protein
LKRHQEVGNLFFQALVFDLIDDLEELAGLSSIVLRLELLVHEEV